MVLMHSRGSSTINRKVIDLENGKDDVPRTSFVNQLLRVVDERDGKLILVLIVYNVVIVSYLRSWITSTNSIALRAYANTIFFNVSALLVCLISIWVEQNSSKNLRSLDDVETRSIFDNSNAPVVRPYPKYRTTFASRSSGWSGTVEADVDESANGARGDGNCVEGDEKFGSTTSNGDEARDRNSITVLGLEKYEVLALLVSSCMSLVAGSLVSVEVVARLTEQPNVHTGRLGLGAFLGFVGHLVTIMAYPDAGLNHVVCKALPCPTVGGCNPILAGNVIGAVILSGTHVVIHFWNVHITDTAAALAVIGLTATSMLPLAFYTLNVMLQRLPRHMSEQLDKCIREALIIDGVLEFRNERFWTKSFGKLAGELQVRIRRNANENHVLENVVKRLSIIVSTLTVQEFRDSRPTKNSVDHPIEYYINEILPRDDDVHSNVRIVDEKVTFMKIDDILQLPNPRIEKSAKSSSSSSSDGSIDRRSIANSCEIFPIALTVHDNENVRFKDRLYRFDSTKGNALLSGATIDFDRLKKFSIAEKKNFRVSEQKL